MARFSKIQLTHFFICLWVFCTTSLANEYSANASEVADARTELLRERLESANSIEERFAILMEIREVAGSPGMPVLLRAISRHADDSNSGVRCAAILALAQISYEHATACPPELVSALRDPDPEIRRAASENIVPDSYAQLPDNVIDVSQSLLNEAKYRDARAAAPTLLHHYRKDAKKVEGLLNKAIADRDFLVRCNAAAALIARDESLELAMPFLMQSTFGECEREFYSKKLGWSSISDAKEVAVFQDLHRRLLNIAAKKYPVEVLRQIGKRLGPQENETVATALAIVADAPKTKRGGVARLTDGEIVRSLQILTRDQDPQIADLAQLAIDQLFTSDVDAE